MFDNKLENILKESKTYATTVTNATDMIKQQREENNGNDFRQILKEARNEQLANERGYENALNKPYISWILMKALI